MREIEFRGKDIKTGEWFFGNLMQWENRAFINFMKLSTKGNYRNKWIEINPETVVEHNDLKDKNDKKIFEGDIVKVFTEAKAFNDGFADYPEREYIRKVEIMETSFGLLSVFGVFIMGSLCNPTVEVISNIHDNPELLKGK